MIKIVDKSTDVQQILKKCGAISHCSEMDERLFIWASRVAYTPELDLVVCFIEVIHYVFVQSVFPHILQELKLLINDACGSMRSHLNLTVLYGVDPDV
jgi:hypothetical protein